MTTKVDDGLFDVNLLSCYGERGMMMGPIQYPSSGESLERDQSD